MNSASVPADAPPSYMDEFGSKGNCDGECKDRVGDLAHDSSDSPRSGESADADEREEFEEGNGEEEQGEERDSPRRTAPSRWRRLLTIIFSLALVWGILTLLGVTEKKEKVLYADRYSKDFKYRPAASPIITKQLKDGTTVIHGAAPTTRAVGSSSTPNAASGERKTKRNRKTKSKQKKGKAKMNGSGR